tara:strand:+ start:6827 stop:7516 length:690 start_codon:yes stop_codon:yes gene_type:complete
MQQRDQDVTKETDTADALRAALAALKDSGADHLDPVRFHYIQAMTARAERQHTAVARLLLSKAWHALQSYQTQLVEQRAAAAPLLEQASARHPDLAEQARQLYDSCEFKALRRLARTQQQYDAPDSLASLTRQLQAGTGESDSATSGDSQELKAVHHFREALQRQHADKLVTQAIMDAPESAGPLNPQKLALRSLAIMREESPEYLARFVSYVDTVFWLERLDLSPPAK